MSDELIKPKERQQAYFFKCLCKWIFDAGLPFSTVENSYFKNMIASVDEHLMVLCRTVVSNEVAEMREIGKLKIPDKLSQIPGIVSVTTDAWSSQLYRRNLSMKIHWVDENWCLMNVLLNFVRFPIPYSVENTSALLFEMLSNWVFLKVSRKSRQVARPKCA